jgi:hypothetical protein
VPHSLVVYSVGRGALNAEGVVRIHARELQQLWSPCSPTGRGTTLRTSTVRVRLPPRVRTLPVEQVADLRRSCKAETAGSSPATGSLGWVLVHSVALQATPAGFNSPTVHNPSM